MRCPIQLSLQISIDTAPFFLLLPLRSATLATSRLLPPPSPPPPEASSSSALKVVDNTRFRRKECNGQWELAKIKSTVGDEASVMILDGSSKAGPVLLAINPFKDVQIYGDDYVTAYREKILENHHHTCYCRIRHLLEVLRVVSLHPK